MARQTLVDRLLRREPRTRSVVRAVPTIVRRVARAVGGVLKRAARVVGSIVGRR